MLNTFNNSVVVVCGGGGFIGGHLVSDLRKRGFHKIRAVDIKPLSSWYQVFEDVENLVLDLKVIADCRRALENCSTVYNLASDMGGMGFIEHNKSLCMLNVLINTHLLQASREVGVESFFFASTACVYNAEKQREPKVTALKEEDAYPALPEDGYGWEKLFGERMCRHFSEDFGFKTTVARFHNVYGTHGTFKGGREKAPAAICRKVIEAKLSGNLKIEIWGDGEQTRSFTYIDDCIRGIQMISESTFTEPLNLGSSRLVSINELVTATEEIAGVKLKREYLLAAPRGVVGRNSDNTLIKKVFNWEPTIDISTGLAATYSWIYDQIRSRWG